MLAKVVKGVLFGCLLLAPSVGFAQSIAASADAGRVKVESKAPIAVRLSEKTKAPSFSVPKVVAPAGAKNIHFVLKSLRIDGATVFTPEQLKTVSSAYVDKEITLDTVYVLADKLSQYYREAGYFLSLAYVPNQNIKDGKVVLQVVEGFVGQVDIENKDHYSAGVQDYIDRLLKQKPLTSAAMESFLLRINDLPGVSFKGVLASLEGGKEGETKLILVEEKKSGSGSIVVDNFGSRFLGPQEGTASYTKSLLPFQQTTVSALTSLPSDEINHFSLEHSAIIAPDLKLEIVGSITKAQPGFYLKKLDVKSDSKFLSAGLNYQFLRQRQENMSFKLGLDGRNSNTDALSTNVSKDNIRALRAGVSWDGLDKWSGSNSLQLNVSKGISWLDSSEKGDLNLSRAQASPNFSKVELSLNRLQSLAADWSLMVGAQSQLASGSLFSSEEFGYGGQLFGRAFDSSEITGDNGLSGSLELRYDWLSSQNIAFEPYVFYDVGAVWNKNTGQPKYEKGAAMGLGARASSDFGLSGNIGLAWPLMRDVVNPIYGQANDSPRVLLQISQSF